MQTKCIKLVSVLGGINPCIYLRCLFHRRLVPPKPGNTECGGREKSNKEWHNNIVVSFEPRGSVKHEQKLIQVAMSRQVIKYSVCV